MNDPVIEKSVPPESPKQSDASFFGYALVALGLALIVRFFVATPFIVSGSSMEHTFENHDYLIVDRISYRVHELNRGDVIVFGLPNQETKDLIKRVIGLPGETVVLSGNNVTIINTEHPEGFTLAEPYLTPTNLGGPTDIRVTLKPDEFFVLGDNRKVSADSRYWGILPRADIVGRVFLRLYPFTTIGITPGEARY